MTRDLSDTGPWAIEAATARSTWSSRGGVPEWSNGAVSKTVVPSGYRGFESHSLRQIWGGLRAALFFVITSCALKPVRSSIFCSQLAGNWGTIGCLYATTTVDMAINPKVEFRLPPIMHSYLKELADIGAYGKGATGVAKRFVEQGIADALDKKVIVPKSVEDFDDDEGED